MIKSQYVIPQNSLLLQIKPFTFNVYNSENEKAKFL